MERIHGSCMNNDDCVLHVTVLLTKGSWDLAKQIDRPDLGKRERVDNDMPEANLSLDGKLRGDVRSGSARFGAQVLVVRDRWQQERTGKQRPSTLGTSVASPAAESSYAP